MKKKTIRECVDYMRLNSVTGCTVVTGDSPCGITCLFHKTRVWVLSSALGLLEVDCVMKMEMCCWGFYDRSVLLLTYYGHFIKPGRSSLMFISALPIAQSLRDTVKYMSMSRYIQLCLINYTSALADQFSLMCQMYIITY